MFRVLATVLTSCLLGLVGAALYNKPYLPLSLVPYHYDLEVLTHLEDANNLHFEGSVTIFIRALDATDLVVVHTLNLTLNQIELRNDKGTEQIPILDKEVNESLQFLILHTSTPLKKGNLYRLFITFGRKLQEGKGSYFLVRNENNVTKEISWNTFTQFERNQIRAALPSFDEPALRATFNVTLGHHKRYASFSNMPILRKLPNNELKDYIWSVHEVTPPMPTYLLAFSINNYICQNISVIGQKPVTLRTCTYPNDVGSANYATYNGAKLLHYFGELLDSPFPLEKIDQLAIPNFHGGMENWGLVKYDLSILTKSSEITFKSNNRMASLIAHELAHMWFGDLVTNAWWDNLWLKEGFATYFAVLGVKHLHPEWEYGKIEFSEITRSALSFDETDRALAISNPVEVSHIQHTDFIIVYKKAAAVIRMLHGILGDMVFYKGLRNYLRNFGYGSTFQDQLWIQMQQANERMNAISTNIHIKTIMDSWTLQPGYPLVTVKRDKTGQNLILTQENHKLNDSNNQCWWVPLSYTTQSEANFSRIEPRAWLDCNTNYTTLTINATKEEWVIFNTQSMNYYRVNYEKENWKLISRALSNDPNSIHVLNRNQILDDVLYLLRNNLIDVTISYDVISYLRMERSPVPWITFITGMSKWKNFPSPIRVLYNTLLRELYGKYGDLNHQSKRVLQADDRECMEIITFAACMEGIENCVSDAFKYLTQLIQSGKELDTLDDYVEATLTCAVKRHATAKQRVLFKHIKKGKSTFQNIKCENSEKISA